MAFRGYNNLDKICKYNENHIMSVWFVGLVLGVGPILVRHVAPILGVTLSVDLGLGDTTVAEGL